MKNLVDPIEVEGKQLLDFSNVMGLAWRKDYLASKESGKIVSRREYILEEIAKVSDDLDQFYRGNTTDSVFDAAFEKRGKLVAMLFGPSYYGSVSRRDVEDFHHTQEILASIGEYIGFEAALDEIRAINPDRVSPPDPHRGKHWQRQFHFSIVKEYFRVLRTDLFSAIREHKWERDGKREFPICLRNLAPYLQIKLVNIENDDDVFSLYQNLNSCSDKKIYDVFLQTLRDKSHTYHSLFRAVDKVAAISSLTSLSAMERSLAYARKRMRDQ